MELSGMSSCIFCPLLLLIIQLSFSFSLHEGNETDRLSFLAFKAQITDPLDALSSWNASTHFCKWSGVICGHRHQRIVELNLQSSQLTGNLSPHIGNLSFLRVLNLEGNYFSRDIPQELGRLFRLQRLVLGNNTFSGEIPVNISSCSNLLVLHLGNNNLTGKIPAQLGSLSKLGAFVLQGNNLVGDIPSSFGNLSSVQNFFWTKNYLRGGIPDSLGNLKRLKYFAVAENDLSGTIPSSICNISSLAYVSLGQNQLHGSLPPDLGLNLPNLAYLVINFNHLNGPIPATLSNASKIFLVDLSYNNLTGKIPDLASLPDLQKLLVHHNDLGNGEEDDLSFLYTLANSTNLESLGINDNNFGGVLPEIVSNFSTNLKGITFGRNQIHGSIPTEIGNLISLDTLSLETNQLHGIIPSSIGKLQNLAALYLNENKISGSIPSSLGNITSLVEVSFAQNNLQGTIPASLGNWHKLLILDLSQNNLSGPIPKEVLGISSLSVLLYLHDNQLTGSLPSEVGQLVNLGFLRVSKNRLSGEIPKSLDSCKSLEGLDLGGNFFEGPVPDLSSLRALQMLLLSYNNLSGQIPQFLKDFKLLETLDLSYNDFEGEVPEQGVFENTSRISVQGNKKLCGGIPQLDLPKCTSNEPARPKSHTKLILIIAIPCGFLGIVLMTSFLLFYSRKTKDEPASGPSWESSFQRLTYQDLLQATDGFSSSNLVGAGAFGSVYRGTLTSDGAVVAVKVLNLLRKGASKSFMAECAALINIRHRNLVKVITACSSNDFQGNDFKALVYEFMVNGSLEEWLHPVHISDVTPETRNLDLVQRLNIAIDVASALDYLHNHCQVPVVHCDLKPSNVLLGDDMTACVGDFGLARFLPEASNQLPADESSSVGLKGTIGYAAPGNIRKLPC
jgi:Leucine-rich repeat (LRR) protein